MDSIIRRSAHAAFRIGPSGSLSWMSLINAALLIALLLAVFTVRLNASSITVGQVAGSTVVAQRTVSYPDQVLTAAARKKAGIEVAAVYKANPALAQERRRQAANFLQAAAPIASS